MDQYIAGPGINPRHVDVDALLVKKFYEFFSENLRIDSTRVVLGSILASEPEARWCLGGAPK